MLVMGFIFPVNLHPLFLFSKHGSVCDPEKNQVQNVDLRKAGYKKQGYFHFSRSILWTWFFLSSRTKKKSGGPDKLEKWMQNDWTIGSKSSPKQKLRSVWQKLSTLLRNKGTWNYQNRSNIHMILYLMNWNIVQKCLKLQ